MSLDLYLPGFEPTPQERRRVIRMHVADAGHMPGGTKGIRFTCDRCGHDTGWIEDFWTISENKRGQPCPECNKESERP